MQKVVCGLRDDVVEQLKRDTAFWLAVDGDVEEDAGVGHVGVCVDVWVCGMRADRWSV